MFFLAAAYAGEVAFHQERSELVPSDLGKDRKQISCAAIGNPHFLAI